MTTGKIPDVGEPLPIRTTVTEKHLSVPPEEAGNHPMRDSIHTSDDSCRFRPFPLSGNGLDAPLSWEDAEESCSPRR
jgi:hypothetical protein